MFTRLPLLVELEVEPFAVLPGEFFGGQFDVVGFENDGAPARIKIELTGDFEFDSQAIISRLIDLVRMTNGGRLVEAESLAGARILRIAEGGTGNGLFHGDLSDRRNGPRHDRFGRL